MRKMLGGLHGIGNRPREVPVRVNDAIPGQEWIDDLFSDGNRVRSHSDLPTVDGSGGGRPVCYEKRVSYALQREFGGIFSELGAGSSGVTFYVTQDIRPKRPESVVFFEKTDSVPATDFFGNSSLVAKASLCGSKDSLRRAHAEWVLSNIAELASCAESSGVGIPVPYSFHCVLLDSGEHLCVYVMSRVAGTSLSDATSRLDLNQAKSVCVSLDRAVSKMLEHGLVHRDLTGTNVFVSQEGGVSKLSLIDFESLAAMSMTACADAFPSSRQTVDRIVSEVGSGISPFGIVDGMRLVISRYDPTFATHRGVSPMESARGGAELHRVPSELRSDGRAGRPLALRGVPESSPREDVLAAGSEIWRVSKL